MISQLDHEERQAAFTLIDEAKSAIDMIRDSFVGLSSDWQDRVQYSLDLLKQAKDCLDEEVGRRGKKVADGLSVWHSFKS